MAGLADFSPPSSSVLPWLNPDSGRHQQRLLCLYPVPETKLQHPDTHSDWGKGSTGEPAEGSLVRNLLKKGDSHPAASGGFHDQIKYPEMRMLWSRSCPPTPLASAPCSYPLLLCASTRVHQAMSWTKLKDQWLWIGSLNRDSIQ